MYEEAFRNQGFRSIGAMKEDIAYFQRGNLLKYIRVLVCASI